jgi:hypothetical protein
VAFGKNCCTSSAECHDELAMHQTAIFLVVYGEVYHGYVAVLLNKNAGLQFGLGAQNELSPHTF